MVKLVQQRCYECDEPITRACERCEQWNARIRNWYAGKPDHELQAIADSFKLRQHVT